MARAAAFAILLVAGCGADLPPPADGEAIRDAATAAPPDATIPVDAAAAGPFQPTMRAPLAMAENSNEDPFVLLDGGTIYVTWYSSRLGNPDIWITKTTDGKNWAAPAQLTRSSDADYYPSLTKVNGQFELVWFRQGAGGRNLYFNRGADPMLIDPANEVQATTDPGADDWVPSMVVAPNGDRVVYFASVARSPNQVSDLFRVTSSDGKSWSAPARVDALDAAAEHDDLPAAIRAGDGSYFITWVRQDTADRGDPSKGYLPWVNPTSELYYATSADALAWSAPKVLTAVEGANVIDSFPALCPLSDGSTHLVWLSAPWPSQPGVQTIHDLSLVDLDNYPAAGGTLPIPGYSPHLSSTPNPGVAFAVWVEGPPNAQQLYDRFLAYP